MADDKGWEEFATGLMSGEAAANAVALNSSGKEAQKRREEIKRKEKEEAERKQEEEVERKRNEEAERKRNEEQKE